MSVQTEADKKLEAARISVNNALIELNEILVYECPGHDEYSEELRNNIEESFQLLMSIRKKLK